MQRTYLALTWLAHSLLVLATVANSAPVEAPDNNGNGTTKVVSLTLGKKVQMKKGHLGQPLTSYYVDVEIGTPAKPFKLLLDINSRETWVPQYSNLGLVCTRLNYREGYSRSESTSASGKNDSESYLWNYSNCKMYGQACTDVIKFNKLISTTEAAYEQRFLAMTNAASGQFALYAVDGVLSLSPWPISASGSELTSVGLVRAGLVDELKFALKLYADIISEHGGELTLGGANQDEIMGPLKYHELVSRHYWQLKLNGVLLGAKMVACGEPNDNCTALISTKINEIMAPIGDIRLLAVQLGVVDTETEYDYDKLYDIDCAWMSDAPALTFIIDDTHYTVPPKAYIRERVDGYMFKSSACYLAIMSNGGTSRWELGTNFLSNYYAVFDVNSQKVALGTRRHPEGI